MLPVYLVLGGKGLRADEKLFIGWFGPRGLASIVFSAMVLHEHLPGGKVIVATVVWTIMMSVVAHGLSANPFAAALGARIKSSGKKG
jgi:NhaP-type Na+/H+ or K+/H+ antiporter